MGRERARKGGGFYILQERESHALREGGEGQRARCSGPANKRQQVSEQARESGKGERFVGVVAGAEAGGASAGRIHVSVRERVAERSRKPNNPFIEGNYVG